MPSRTETIGIVTALVVVGAAFFASNYISFGSMQSNPLGNAGTNPAAVNDTLLQNLGVTEAPVSAPATSASGLVIQDLVIGSGEEAKAGMVVTANYTGALQDGTVFDSSIPRGQPYEFVLGAGAVIKGWDEGILGMKVGGKRLLVIPPTLGYGSSGIGPIPPNATLTFQVELVGVRAK